MELHGKSLAQSHKLATARVQDDLLSRLAENEDVLTDAVDLLTAAIIADQQISPAGEWLLDNFYLIEEQIRTAKRHLPKDYSRELPRLANGPSAGLPRVYDIALETISHGDGRVDPEALSRFVAAYQTVTDLNLGELWAIPIMLRLALIENLRRVASRLAAHRIDRNLAGVWADQMTEIAGKDPKSLILVVADMARSNPPIVSSFVAEFARRLQGQGAALALPLTWIEQRLAENGLTIERLVQSENQQQAADQVSISNSIGSLRFLGAMDWREFVEDMSVVEKTLRQDPVYGAMDFATRDRYRHVVEKTAKNSARSEHEVARLAVELATNKSDRAGHVGYYLIDKGLPQLQQKVGTPFSVSSAFQGIGKRFPLALYLGSIALVTAILAGALLLKARTALGLVGVVSVLCASHLAISLVNWLVTLFARPHKLPRMDFSEGIPAECRTLVVVPTLLTGPHNAERLIEALEVRYLANQGENIHFGLLTDFPDAHEETIPEDALLLELARKGIAELNKKYGGPKRDIFFLFHRPRRWNPRERLWMGYERKRGKLSDLNALLRGRGADRFSLVVGNTDILSSVKYVITLDTDTQLPRDAAWQCAGAMAHPLNRARYSESRKRVCEGYGILQPRVAVSLPSGGMSRYARLWGSDAGVDPYTRAISDVYQDLFSEGSFIGKGIYDVDAFEQSLNDRLPENQILSHDLLEGCYARAGLLSDVQFYEEYPSRYSADVSRRHRWIRGDWQIARWMLPGVPGPGIRFQSNPLSGLSRWKILDNLRRSLVPPALTLLLALGWTMLAPVWLWTLAVIGIILLPALMMAVLELFRKPDDSGVRQHLALVAQSLGRHCVEAAFTFACLPYEAFYSLDAVLRTIGRMLIIRRRLLEWSPSSEQDRKDGGEHLASWRTMWIGPTLAASAWIYLTASNPAALLGAAPVLALWFTSPAIAWWLSQPPGRRKPRLTEEQTVFLGKIARKTWSFFETFVGADDHWLPPDNYQEHPVAVIAHRTSPTNIGLSLLANLTAYDFGYISGGQLIERTTDTFFTMGTLERRSGHFYNWYDTQSLKPLTPIYISTVDSGNLAGHLLTLRAGLLELPDHKILGARFFAGLEDTLRVLVDTVGDADPEGVVQLQQELVSTQESPPATLADARERLDRLAASAAEVAHSLEAAPQSEPAAWARSLVRQCLDAIDQLTFLAPPELSGEIPTLRKLASLDSHPLASFRARERIALIEGLSSQASEYATMDYEFLFDRVRNLLSIGYNVGEHRLDSSCYDLLASESRLCSFVAIAQGQLPQENWFALGRNLTSSGGAPALISWSGSMFEYLMPLLVMPEYEGTLLDETCKAAVERQIKYGDSRKVPWGISESGYNAVDNHLNYQYRAFGVPGLGLKRGLGEDLVIAPYASAMALMVAPEEACLNLQRLSKEGFEARYGFYEAIDYTPSRLPRGEPALWFAPSWRITRA
jgi:hypothetical protein